MRCRRDDMSGVVSFLLRLTRASRDGLNVLQVLLLDERVGGGRCHALKVAAVALERTLARVLGRRAERWTFGCGQLGREQFGCASRARRRRRTVVVPVAVRVHGRHGGRVGGHRREHGACCGRAGRRLHCGVGIEIVVGHL